jgi:hypothetical protein
MNKSREYLLRPLVANYESAKVLKPFIAALYDPSALVPAHLSPVLMCSNRVVAPRWNNRLYPLLYQQCEAFAIIKRGQPSFSITARWKLHTLV